MRLYRVRETISFSPGGRLKLAPEQSAPRLALGALIPVSEKKGETVFRVERPVQFKVGEIIGTDDELPRVQTERLEEVDEEGNPVVRRSGKVKSSGKAKSSGEGGGSDEGGGLPLGGA